MKNKSIFALIAVVLVLTVVLSAFCTFSVFATNGETAYIKGDANLDQKVNIKDTTAIQKYLAKLLDFSDEQLKLADMDGNGSVNVKDATYIQKLIAGIIDESTPDENIPQWGTPVLPPVTSTDDEAQDDDKPIILPVIPAA